jgi:very-short-patch-repair endonuclease
LKNIALKYKTRGEFQRLDNSAYTTSRIAGYLDDICSHMVCGSYSIPQLVLLSILKILFDNDNIEYNCRNIIKPYELDVYIDKYKIGFEYDGKLWHIDNKLDKIKTELCKNNSITLIRLKENNRKYIEDIKNQLINNIKIINATCNTNFKNIDIINIDDNYINDFINDEIVDDEKIIEIVSKYTNYHDFKINETSLYSKLIRTKLLDKFTSHLKRDKIFWTEELAIIEIKKYDNLSDFINKSFNCYLYIKKNKLSNLLKDLKTKCHHYTILELEEEIKKYEYLKDFREQSKNYYGYIKKNKLNYLINDLKRTVNRKPDFFISDIISEIKKYDFLIDFKKKSFKHYCFVIKHHLYYLTKNLKRNKTLYSISEIKYEIDKYVYLKDFREQSNSYYRYIQRYKLTDILEYSKKLK